MSKANEAKACPGCGDELRTVGAMARAQGGCCGGIMYELCLACALKMQQGDDAERSAMIERIELALVEAGGEA